MQRTLLCRRFLLALADALVKRLQLFAKGKRRLPSLPVYQAGYGRLSGSALFANLRLRQVAQFLYFGDKKFPIHCASITLLRSTQA
jgi:hypothetical protein